MNIECGTDIIEINRIKESIEQFKEQFKNRIYTEKEKEYCEQTKNAKYEHYAGRFAAKEAVYKAINKNEKEIKWTDIEILRESNGSPKVELHIEIEKLKEVKISISHCREYATATAIAIYE